MKTVRLSPFSEELVPLVIKWAETPANAEFFRRCPPMRHWLTPVRAMALWKDAWAVFEDADPVGLALMTATDPYSRSTEFSILVDKSSSKQHHDTAAAVYHECLTYAFDHCNLNKVYVKLLDSRVKLKAIAEELLGFKCEAILKDSVFYKGEYRNEFLLACFKDTYKRN